MLLPMLMELLLLLMQGVGLIWKGAMQTQEQQRGCLMMHEEHLRKKKGRQHLLKLKEQMVTMREVLCMKREGV